MELYTPSGDLQTMSFTSSTNQILLLYHIVIITILVPSPFSNHFSASLSNKLDSPALILVTSSDMIPPGGITRFSLQLSLVHSLPFIVSSWSEDSGLSCFALWLLWRSPSLLPLLQSCIPYSAKFHRLAFSSIMQQQRYRIPVYGIQNFTELIFTVAADPRKPWKLCA